MGTVNKNSSYSPVGPWVCFFLCFLGCMIYVYVGVCFVLPWTVESFPFMFWRWCNKLKWAPFELFALSPYCGLGAGSIPFRAIVNNKQCEMRELFMSLVIHDWMGDVQDSQGLIRLRNGLYCVGWGVKLYSLTRLAYTAYRLHVWPSLWRTAL